MNILKNIKNIFITLIRDSYSTNTEKIKRIEHELLEKFDIENNDSKNGDSKCPMTKTVFFNKFIALKIENLQFFYILI